MNGMLVESNGPTVKKSARRKKPRNNSSPSDGVPKSDLQPESPLPVTTPVYPQSVAPTTLERSLASISHVNGGPDIPSFTTPASLKQKKKPKKKKKSTNSAFADGDTDEDENPWMPVSSKKTKITKTQANKETVEPTETPSAPVNVDAPEKKKRKRKSDKKTQPASVISPEETSQQHASPVTPPQVAPVSATPAVPPSQSVSSCGDVEPAHSKQPRRKTTSLRAAETPGGSGVVQHSQVDHTKPDAAATVKAPPSQKTLLTYAQELEFLVVEALGLETLVSTRTRFTELALPDLSAVSAAPTALSATQLPPDVIQLRAHLRAKEAECQVLRDEVVRMHSDIIALKTAALSAASAPPPPPPPQPAQEKPQPVKVTCASKSVQSEPVPQETASSRPSDIVIMTLQEEIGRLAKESTLMSQRNANLEKRLSNMQSEMHRATAKATRTAEASAAERIEKSEARVKQLQVELNEKNQLLASQRSQLEQAEDVNLKSNQELQRVLREYENLRKADADLKEELAGASSQVQELQQQLAAKEMERESAVRKERLAAQALTEAREQVEHLESSLKAEGLSSAALKQRIDQLMSDTEKDRGLTQQLEEDLADSKRELSARQESLAKAEEQASSAQRELLSVRQELDQAHTECDSLRSKLASAQQELDAAQKALASTTATATAAANEAAAADAADVEEVVVPQSVALTSSSSSAEPQEASSTAFSEEESCTSCSALASEVEHYKSVLDSTENVLSKLQTTVAQEEGRWRKSLQDVTSENASLKTTVKRLTEEVADLNRKHREPAGEVLENGNCADDEEHVENGHCAAAPSQPINGGDFQ